MLTTWVHYRHTTSFLLPTLRTRDAVDADISAAWNLLDGADAPVPTEVGFVVLATIAVWIVATAVIGVAILTAVEVAW